jgi:hypothetical protein
MTDSELDKIVEQARRLLGPRLHPESDPERAAFWACKRCGIQPRVEGGHYCEDCGRNI